MRITLLAVGRLRKSPELALIDDYLDRFAKTGRGLGLPPVQLVEVEDKRGGGMAAEAALLDRVIPSDAALVTLDERGQMLTSPEFADRIAGFRDQARDIAFVIGGADGLDPALKRDAMLQLRLSSFTLPHALAQLVLCEQLYRAVSLLRGHPYHRE